MTLAAQPSTTTDSSTPPARLSRKSATAYRFFVVVSILVGDVIAAAWAVSLAYDIRFFSGWMTVQIVHRWEPYQLYQMIFAGSIPVIFMLQRLYKITRSMSRIDELYKIFAGCSIATVVALAGSAFLYREFDYSRAVLPIAWIIAIALIWLQRMLQYQVHGFLRSRGLEQENLLVVGDGDMARVILERVAASPRLGYRAVGVLSTGKEKMVADVPVVGHPEDIVKAVRRHNASEVIIADSTLSHETILDILARCDREEINIRVFPNLFQILASEVSIGDFEGLPLVSVRDTALRGWNLMVKRSVDIAVSLLVLIILSPLMLAIAILIKLSSPNSQVFHVQERVGLDGRPFGMLKFRSMRPDAEGQTGPVWTVQNDPRRTWIGGLLRRISFDELPQFINVLVGEMSVVGPRPERPHFVAQFSQHIPRYLDRHREKAGITGWAQVNGLRGNTPIEERTAYDLWYVENWTLWLDFKIMLRTVMAMVDRNAY